MSFEALKATWDITEKLTSFQKVILLALANRASINGICWPSIRKLEEDTGINRKTIIKHRKALVEKGLITFTGETKGHTGRVKVMQLPYLNKSHNEQKDNSTTFDTLNSNSTTFGTGNSPKNGTGNSTTFGTLNSPKSGTRNLKEETVKRTNNRNQVAVALKNGSSTPTATPTPPPQTSEPPLTLTTSLPTVVTSQWDERLLTAYHSSGHPIPSIHSPRDFLLYVAWSIKQASFQNIDPEKRARGILTLLTAGTLKIEDEYLKTRMTDEQRRLRDLRMEHQEFVGRLKADITLGLKSANDPICQQLDFDNWLSSGNMIGG